MSTLQNENLYLKNEYHLTFLHESDAVEAISGKGTSKRWSTFRFDSIVSMEAELGVGLYTEGTGNLHYSKGATNPIQFVFRKTLDITNKSGTKILGKRLYQLGKNTSLSFGDRSDQELSIFKWAELINSGKIDRAPVHVYSKIIGENDKEVLGSQGSVCIFRLTNAIATNAVIRQNPHQDINVAELTFVAQAISSSNFLDDTYLKESELTTL